MILYKSRLFWIIQDLSYQPIINSIKYPSLNNTIVRIAPPHVVAYIGLALSQILLAIVSALKYTPILLSKADIIDGFWKVFTEAEGC